MFNKPRFLHLLLLLVIFLFVLGALPPLRPTSALSSLTVQIKSNGTDNNQQTAFSYLIKNSGSAISGVSVRVYFILDGSNAASNYTLEKYYDQSGVATITGPTLAAGTTYYFTVNYGTASLASSAQWELQTALHLSTWASTFNSANDHFHTGFAVGALPTAYTNTDYLPAYISGTLSWGSEPGSVPTNTPTQLTPATASTANDTVFVDLVVTNIYYAPGVPACTVSSSKNVTVKNQGNISAGSFVVRYQVGGSTTPIDQTVPSLAAGASVVLNFASSGQGGTVFATADILNQVVESNEANNSLTTQLPFLTQPPTCTPIPGPLPDLSVTSIRAVNVGTICQPSYVTDVGIANFGSADATAPFVVRYNNVDQTVPSLAMGATSTVRFNNGIGSNNSATIDATNVIAEANEVNNTFNLSTTPTPTGTMPPNCLVTPTFTPSPSPTPGVVCQTLGLKVSPVTSPTSLLTQIINASITNGGIPQYTVFAKDSAGTTLSTTRSSTGAITIPLQANTIHILTVTVNAEVACVRPDGSIASLTFVTEAKTVDTSGNPLVIVQHSSTPTSTLTPTPTNTTPCTCTCASSCATATAIAAMTQTAQARTFTPSPTPTITRTPTSSYTPSMTNTPGGDPCASPTVITGGGTFAVGTTAKCFKYVNTSFVRGGMFSVMKDGTSASDTLQWYGGLDQNVTACANQSKVISGNGGQLNNFTIAKDASGQMFLTVTGSAANNVTISITNWQNGNGCSAAPTVHP